MSGRPALFGPGVVTRSARIDEPVAPPLGAEASLAARMAPGRRRHFLAGRALARAALGELGVPAVALGRDPGGAPCWPDGVVGSITHCGDGAEAWCAVAVASASDRLALGIDAEPDEPLDRSLWARVLRPDEAALARDGRLARLVFSAKEAVYKAVYPLAGRYLDFHDVAIDLDPRRQRFAARVPPGAGPARLAGRWRRHAGLIVTAVEIPAVAPRGPGPDRLATAGSGRLD